ncbi:phosphoserine phosphatase, chloroplastic-like [Gossypium arboreum]|uniref:phosphoserine phosphatase, chloroplastic-like n=1 Tax=Gossypium arboreum TaxID=29729 RepID=UPI0022F1A1A8|nr:phosphoserine phosphatase, chloroplastic-like [Gossypium arboreum]
MEGFVILAIKFLQSFNSNIVSLAYWHLLQCPSSLFFLLISKISPGIEELVKKLKARNTDIYLISEGFRQMINHVASILGIPQENIFANQLLFGSSREFLGFDVNEPTSRSEGKVTAVQQIRKVKGYKALVMIGDGATDLEDFVRH